jgi:hypothetical protein
VALLLVLGASALFGGGELALAAGTRPALAEGYSYSPANCHSAPTLPDTSGSKHQYADYLVHTIAPRYHLEAAVLLWQVQQESGFNPQARSPAGAIMAAFGGWSFAVLVLVICGVALYAMGIFVAILGSRIGAALHLRFATQPRERSTSAEQSRPGN